MLFQSTNSFINLTNEKIPPSVQNYIELGPNFIPPITRQNIPKIELIETILNINDLQKEQYNNVHDIREKLITSKDVREREREVCCPPPVRFWCCLIF